MHVHRCTTQSFNACKCFAHTSVATSSKEGKDEANETLRFVVTACMDATKRRVIYIVILLLDLADNAVINSSSPTRFLIDSERHSNDSVLVAVNNHQKMVKTATAKARHLICYVFKSYCQAGHTTKNSKPVSTQRSKQASKLKQAAIQ